MKAMHDITDMAILMWHTK